MKRDTLGYEACYDWIISALTPLSDNFLDIVMKTNLSEISVSFLKDFRAVYIGGGNTYKLLDEVRKSGFDKLIIDFLSKGGIVYGGSAGAIIFGKDISIVSEEKDREISTHGLDLLNGFAIRCHYTPKDDFLINKFVKDTQIPVIAIAEGSGLILGGPASTVPIIGNVKIFRYEREGIKDRPFSLSELFS